MADTKECRRCRQTLPVERFVDRSGRHNPRGHYCLTCPLRRLDDRHRATLKRERLTIQKLRIIYGPCWRHHAAPEYFQASLLDERDFCPYCGTWFDQITPHTFNSSPLHLDHMNPLDKGGENSIRNVVVCCGPYNIRKGKRSFIDWLAMLEPKYRQLARAIYRHKHGHPPEAFIAGQSTKRGWPYLETTLHKPVAELKKLFPRPVSHDPPRQDSVRSKADGRKPGSDLSAKQNLINLKLRT
ncbi:MAG: HNH endonuclease domain-containing protein [Syntrophotaleaceae bacterium]